MVGNVKELAGKLVFDELVDRDATAHLLEVSPRTLDRWHLLREGPPRIRYGRMVRYRLSAIEDWLSAHETSSPHIANDWQPKRGSPVTGGAA
jgi:predicted DNA-binding transcriptional regulator AlpA